MRSLDDMVDEMIAMASHKHPVSQKLNRELIACFRRLGSAHLEKEKAGDNDAAVGSPVDRD